MSSQAMQYTVAELSQFVENGWEIPGWLKHRVEQMRQLLDNLEKGAELMPEHKKAKQLAQVEAFRAMLEDAEAGAL